MSKVQRMMGLAVVMLLIAGCSDKIAPTAAAFAVGSLTAGARMTRGLSSGILVSMYPTVLRPVPHVHHTHWWVHSPGPSACVRLHGISIVRSPGRWHARNRSIASQLSGIGALPQPKGIPYRWPLVANAAMAEVMRGLSGDKTDHAAPRTSPISMHSRRGSCRSMAQARRPASRNNRSTSVTRSEPRSSRHRLTMGKTKAT